MNIIIDGHSLHVLGGVERTITDLASNLAMRGYNIFLFLTEQSPNPPLYKLHPNVKTVIYTHNGRRGHLKKFREQIISYNPDVCISPTSDRRHFPWCVALQDTGIPLIICERSSPDAIETEFLTRKERLSIFEAADGIQLLLPTYIQSLPMHLQNKVRPICNAVDLPDVDPMPHEFPTIISMGRLSHEKQNHLLIEAFYLLKKDFPSWRVEIWGTGPEKGRLKEQIKKHALEDNIFLCGLTKEPEQCFATADITCLPSRYEGFPGSVAQAMTVGLPVVGFANCSGINEMIKHGITGYLAPKMSAESLADALRPLMQSEDLRKSMGQAGQKAAHDFTPQKVFNAWEEFLHEVHLKKGATSLQNRGVQELINKELNRGVAKRMNVLVGKGDIARALIFQFPWLKRKLHPFYTWFKCRFLQ